MADQATQPGGVRGGPAERIRRGDNGIVVGAQLLYDTVPAGGVRERAVLQHDRRFRRILAGTGLGCRFGSAGNDHTPRDDNRRDRRNRPDNAPPRAATSDYDHVITPFERVVRICDPLCVAGPQPGIRRMTLMTT